MDYPPVLTKAMVAAALAAWGTGRFSDEGIHLWAINNYWPTVQRVAPSEPAHTRLAMSTILTEFDCANPPFAHFNPAGWSTAISFLDTSAAQYRANEVAFFKECMGHELGPPTEGDLECYRINGIPLE